MSYCELYTYRPPDWGETEYTTAVQSEAAHRPLLHSGLHARARRFLPTGEGGFSNHSIISGDQDLVDLVGLSILREWKLKAAANDASLCDLAIALSKWHVVQKTGLSELVFKEACVCFGFGGANNAEAIEKRSYFFEAYTRSASEPELLAWWSPGGNAMAPASWPSRCKHPLQYTNVTSAYPDNQEWRTCFNMLTYLVMWAASTGWAAWQPPILRLWRDARTPLDFCNLLFERCQGTLAASWAPPATWIDFAIRAAMGVDRLKLTVAKNRVQEEVMDGALQPLGRDALSKAFEAMHARGELDVNGFGVLGKRRRGNGPLVCRTLALVAIKSDAAAMRFLLSLPSANPNVRTAIVFNNTARNERISFAPVLNVSIPSAIQKGFCCLEMLVQDQRCDVNLTDAEGRTALHRAVECIGDLEINHALIWFRLLRVVELLIENGASTLVNSYLNCTPHQLFAQERYKYANALASSSEIRGLHADIKNKLNPRAQRE